MEKIINDFIKFNEVEAIAIGGSSAAQTSDNIFDVDERQALSLIHI